MHRDLELSLSHDGQNWITDYLSLAISAMDLPAMEEQIADVINTDPLFINNDSIHVSLFFDMDIFPKWLHQYQSHYFNYSFTVTKHGNNR